MNVIIISVVVFLSITLLLVFVLLWAKAKLVPSGNVKLNVNDEMNADVPIGGTLLNTLQGQNIFLSSACGGSGKIGRAHV